MATTSKGRVAPRDVRRDLTAVAPDSTFAAALRDCCRDTRPTRIIETGTYLGRGTTTCLARASHDFELEAELFSIECNAAHLQKAATHLRALDLHRHATLLLGLSVPRLLLPTRDQIERELVHAEIPQERFVDHEPNERADRYFAETNFDGVVDDLLGKTMLVFDHRPDLVLLDSAGHLGRVEFDYVMSLLDGPTIIALDDVKHVKHASSYERIKQDERFTVIAEGDEKFGFCIARVSP